MEPILNKYERNLTWGDQDILNVVFHQHRGPFTVKKNFAISFQRRLDWVFPLDCTYNYRPDHCMYVSNCKTAESVGARVLHGSRSYFHKDKQPIFRAVYQAFDKVSEGNSKKRP